MVGVLIGFAIIAVIIGTGYLVGRFDVLGANTNHVLSRLEFFVLAPALLFKVIAEADVRVLFSVQLPVATIAAVVPIVLYLVISLVLWRRSIPDATIGSLASGYVNANNIGIPVAVYVLGDATASAPVILLQLVVLAPIALGVLDVTTSGKMSLGRILTQPIRNPLIIGSLLGLLVALLDVELPEPVMAPFVLAALPTAQNVFNYAQRYRTGEVIARDTVLLTTLLSLPVLVLIAWLLAA